MLFIFFFGTDHELMQQLTRVFDHKFNSFTLLCFNFFGAETHGVEHADFNGAFRHLGISCNAPVLLFFFDSFSFFGMRIAMGKSGQAAAGDHRRNQSVS